MLFNKVTNETYDDLNSYVSFMDDVLDMYNKDANLLIKNNGEKKYVKTVRFSKVILNGLIDMTSSNIIRIFDGEKTCRELLSNRNTCPLIIYEDSETNEKMGIIKGPSKVLFSLNSIIVNYSKKIDTKILEHNKFENINCNIKKYSDLFSTSTNVIGKISIISDIKDIYLSNNIYMGDSKSININLPDDKYLSFLVNVNKDFVKEVNNDLILEIYSPYEPNNIAILKGVSKDIFDMCISI